MASTPTTQITQHTIVMDILLVVWLPVIAFALIVTRIRQVEFRRYQELFQLGPFAPIHTSRKRRNASRETQRAAEHRVEEEQEDIPIEERLVSDSSTHMLVQSRHEARADQVSNAQQDELLEACLYDMGIDTSRDRGARFQRLCHNIFFSVTRIRTLPMPPNIDYNVIEAYARELACLFIRRYGPDIWPEGDDEAPHLLERVFVFSRDHVLTVGKQAEYVRLGLRVPPANSSASVMFSPLGEHLTAYFEVLMTHARFRDKGPDHEVCDFILGQDISDPLGRESKDAALAPEKLELRPEMAATMPRHLRQQWKDFDRKFGWKMESHVLRNEQERQWARRHWGLV